MRNSNGNPRKAPAPRKGMPSPRLDEAEFMRRYRQHFFDPAFSSLLDLSRVTSEFGRHIHPCKACSSTAPTLCHWPCSCYPNHSLGQIHDWMNDIHPMWVEAAGIMIVTPVNWYSTSSR
jgi:hypothetical protein